MGCGVGDLEKEKIRSVSTCRPSTAIPVSSSTRNKCMLKKKKTICTGMTTFHCLKQPSIEPVKFNMGKCTGFVAGMQNSGCTNRYGAEAINLTVTHIPGKLRWDLV